MTHRFAGVLVIASAALAAVAQASQSAVRAPEGFAIAGIVVSSVTGQPVSGATVLISAVTARASAQALTTGVDGRFSFAGLPRGKYSLEAGGKGYRQQGLDQHDAYATAVAVGPELDSEHIVFRLQPDASVEGRVIDDQNEPVENASVQLFVKNTEQGQEKASPRGHANTDDRGYYQIGYLAPGTYYLVVGAHPWYAQHSVRDQLSADHGDPENLAHARQEAAELDKTYPLTFYPNVLDSAEAGTIRLSAGDHFSADVTLQAVSAVHLRVHGRSKNPGENGPGSQVNLMQRVFDQLQPPIQGVGMMSASGSGTVEVTGLAPGRYLVEARPYPASGKADSSTGWFQELDLAGDVDLTVGSSQPFAEVSGILRFEGGPPPRNPVFVQISGHDSGDLIHAPVQPNGQFTFRDDPVRPGRYDIVLGNAQGFALQKIAATGASVSGRTLEITTAGAVHLAGIASPGIGQVEGTALRKGKPVAGAMIVLVPRDPGHNQPLFRRDQSDSDGTFTLANVVPGAYTAVAIDNGWDLEWANPTVLQSYLKGGTPVQVLPQSKLEIAAQVQ